ncbi:NADH:ubiquinone oxidoreductase, partial [Coemansia sp. RSA 678]
MFAKTSLRVLRAHNMRVFRTYATPAMDKTLFDASKTLHDASKKPYDANKKTLVLLGTGWGTTTILKNLDTHNFNVVVVSPRNYFLFTPLLPSCTVGTTESRSIMEPIRHIVGRRGKDMRFIEAECTDIDVAAKQLTLTRTLDPTAHTHIKYDHLVVG